MKSLIFVLFSVSFMNSTVYATTCKVRCVGTSELADRFSKGQVTELETNSILEDSANLNIKKFVTTFEMSSWTDVAQDALNSCVVRATELGLIGSLDNSAGVYCPRK